MCWSHRSSIRALLIDQLFKGQRIFTSFASIAHLICYNFVDVSSHIDRPWALYMATISGAAEVLIYINFVTIWRSAMHAQLSSCECISRRRKTSTRKVRRCHECRWISSGCVIQFGQLFSGQRCVRSGSDVSSSSSSCAPSRSALRRPSRPLLKQKANRLDALCPEVRQIALRNMGKLRSNYTTNAGDVFHSFV